MSDKTEFTINVKVNGLEDVGRMWKAIEGCFKPPAVPRDDGPAYSDAFDKDGGVEPERRAYFSIGDVVSLKSGGPRMTVERIETFPGNPDKCALIGCTWFVRVNYDKDCEERHSRTRHGGDAYVADFPADCLEY